MTEPQTPSGRALLLGRPWLGNDHRHILAIEAESRDAVLDALETAVRDLTRLRAIDRAEVLEEIEKLRRQP